MISYLLKIFALLGLLLLSPFLVIAMVVLFIEDGLPVIFIQKRLGKDKKIFNFYKLRTMKKNAPNKGTHEVSKLNYLKCGHFLRKYKIDELPQVINYIKGDINLVGPRPGLPSQSELNEFRVIYDVFDVRPGITGLSQVLGYDMSDPELLSKLDKIYINNRSVKIDFYIFVATFINAYKSKVYKALQKDIDKSFNGI
ncbi:MAG: sugar transferase [Gammaproteobacteria bacterium]|nr:sugar transferase [Gammaproteobacteria bacterium]|tara:strand:- start:2870 stop:3460 length:591 start_codon:yes stop_codon:yes gene_type:complete